MYKKYLLLIMMAFLLISCKAKTYKVTFMDEGEELSAVEIKKGDSIKDINDPEKEGYLFLGWLKDGIEYNKTTPITEDITLTATWTETPDLPNNHKVNFNFGDFIKTQTVKDGEKATIPKETPKKEKHKFIGWYVGDTLYDFNEPVTKDININAKFEKNRIIISYDLNGGTGSRVEEEIEKDTIPTEPNKPTRFGYTFTNWTIDGEVYKFDKPLTKDTTIKANYEANVYYKVTFDTDGGNEISSQMIIENETIQSLPTPIKEGYKFKYWSYEGHEFTVDTKIDKDITLIAIYEEITEDENN